MGPRPKRTQGPHGRQSGDLAKWSNGKELVQQRSPQKGLLFESPKHHAPCESRRADRAPSDGTPALRDSPGRGGRAGSPGGGAPIGSVCPFLWCKHLKRDTQSPVTLFPTYRLYVYI